ncbi:hypothetical protein G9A89_023142 [Geosiphon pyriformis]|nr:hypothetical protein G9A89_023142 [Geosiphon pyriformis]
MELGYKGLLRNFYSVIDPGGDDALLIKCLNDWCEAQKIEAETLFQQLRSLAEENHEFACIVGICYHYAIGTQFNQQEMLKWYKISAEYGDALGQTQLGWCCSEPFGTELNNQEAIHWHSRSAQGNNYVGMYNLAHCYMWGLGAEVDYQRAFYWYKRSAEAGITNAKFCLARCYRLNFGTPKDLHEAIVWYKKSSGVQPIDTEWKEELGEMFQNFRWV